VSDAATTPSAEHRPAAVRLVDVSKEFNGNAAVSHLNLELQPGEFFALLGPSGCGKTTTLRMVGGFEDPSSGQILLDDVDITWTPPHKRDVNTVFQSYALFPHLSVYDNVAFGLKRRRVSRSTIDSLVREHLALVGLAGFEKRSAHQLSGGQQQRVALARALVNHPSVLLLDEPMGALDAKIRESMRLELKRIQREVGITFLYVTHDQDEAMSLGDRMAVMRAGVFEDLGEPHRVYDRPANEFVAQFLGACNFIPVEGDRGSWRVPGGAPLEIDEPSGSGEKVAKVGVRPEKFHVARQDAGATAPTSANTVAATVATVVYLGKTTEYGLTSPWGGELRALVQSSGSESRFVPGDEVTVSWAKEHCFALPPSEAAAP
jgi:ABC-type Fe3+/spermidine/putrescine transport system ATPase subunit